MYRLDVRGSIFCFQLYSVPSLIVLYHPVRQIVFLAVLSAVVSSSAGSCPVSPTTRMDDFYREFISSDLYIDSVRPNLIADDQFSVLVENYASTSSEKLELVEGALVGGPPTTTTVGPLDAHEPQLGDFIVSDAVLARIRMALSWVQTPPVWDFSEWLETVGREANLELYYLHIELSQWSYCRNLDSRVLRKLIEQIHYRITLGIYTSYEQLVDQWVPVLSSMQREVTGLVFLSGMARSARPAPRMVAAAGATGMVLEVGLEVGCWCIQQCIRYYMNRFTTTTTTTTTSTTPSTIAAWILEGKRKQFDQFLTSSNSNLDEIMAHVGSVTASSDSELESRISSLRTESIVKIVAITKGIVSFTGPTFDPTETLEAAFRLSEFLGQRHSSDDWGQMKRQILVTVVKLRNLLSDLPFLI